MKFRSIRRAITEAIKGIARNSLMSVTSVITVAACILILVFSYCVVINLGYVLEQLENNVGIRVIISDNIDYGQKYELLDIISAIPHVESVHYKSKDDALKEMIERFESQGDSNAASILEDLAGTENPLPDTFDVTLDSVRYQNEAISSIKHLQAQGVDEVKHSMDVAQSLMGINNAVSIIGLIIIVCLAALAIIIIINTIKLTINNRKNEISIMKYVGATDWFVKWPFVLEGLFIGVLGSFIPVLICWLSYEKIVETIVVQISLLQNFFEFKAGFEIFPILFPIAILAGGLIGVVGSISSMRKYLKV